MRIMAVGTQQVFLAPVPVTCPSAMNALFPIPEFRSVTLATELVGFVETDQLSAGCMQHISVVGVMAIHAPSIFFIVLEYDIVMEFFQFSALEVNFHICMTHCTREKILAQRRGRNLNINLLSSFCLLEYCVGGNGLVSG
jgi:hypothetical protein